MVDTQGICENAQSIELSKLLKKLRYHDDIQSLDCISAMLQYSPTIQLLLAMSCDVHVLY